MLETPRGPNQDDPGRKDQMANQRICSIDGCGKPHNAKGLCGMHGQRLKRHGDISKTTKTPNGEPDRFIKDIISSEIVGDCINWPYGRTKKGYGFIFVNGHNMSVGRYVCLLTHGEPPTPKYEAAHSCGNGHMGCVNPGHLSWKTTADNHADKLIHGTTNRGERHGSSKLTEKQVSEIRAMKGIKSQTEIAAMYGISQSNVSRLMSRHNWSWLGLLGDLTS